MTIKPIFTALSDGTHIHHKYDGSETYCTRKHRKPWTMTQKIAILSGWFLSVVLIAHLLLKSNGY